MTQHMDRNSYGAVTAEILLETKSVLFDAQNPFTYTSGRIGPVYVDCRRPISFPKERKTLMQLAKNLIEEKTRDSQIDCVIGGETAGIPYAAFLAEELNLPMAYIRKKPKGVGRLAQIEGDVAENANVLLVEDLQNYGSSQKTFIEALRTANINVAHAFVLFSYGNADAAQQMNDLNVELHALATWRDIINVAKTKNYFDKGTIASVEEYLNDPNKWSDTHLAQRQS